MPKPLHPSLHDADPTMMSRLDFPVWTVIEDTGKNVEEIFGESHDGTGVPKRNKVYHDPDGVGLLVEIGSEDGDMQRFLSLFFKGIVPVTEIIAHREGNVGKGEMKYYSLAFDPAKIQTSSGVAERLAGSHLFEAFGDGDHEYDPNDDYRYNMVLGGGKHYFYDFQLSPHKLKEFPEAQIPYGGYGFMRKDVREVFYRMVRELYARYDGNDGISHFFAIARKAGFSLEKTQQIWIKFMTQLEHLSHLDEAKLMPWVAENEKFMVDEV